jgi:hypothetical protein
MHGQIKIGRGSAVEIKFCFERHAATRRRRKIEIGIADGALQFPRSVAGKKDTRRMRIDVFAWMPVTQFLLEKGDNVRLG